MGGLQCIARGYDNFFPSKLAKEVAEQTEYYPAQETKNHSKVLVKESSSTLHSIDNQAKNVRNIQLLKLLKTSKVPRFFMFKKIEVEGSNETPKSNQDR